MLTRHLTYIEALGIAYGVAVSSLDTSTQNGALLVDRSRGILVRECNRFAQGLERLPEHEERAVKYRRTVHAEQGAILSAARQGIRTEGLILVSPWAMCCECAKAIIHAGIAEVVAHKEILALTPERWIADIAEAKEMLREREIPYTVVTGVVGMKILFDGRTVVL